MTDHGLPYLEAPDLDLPVLATCRGMPLFNVAHGGTLVQHIDGHRVPLHDIKLAAIFGAGRLHGQ